MDEYLGQLDLIASAMDDKDKTPDQLLEEAAYKINLARFKRDWPLLPAPPFLVGISGSFGSGKSSIICWLVNLYLQYGLFKAVEYFSESGQVDPKMKVFSPPDNNDYSYKGANLDKELGKVFVSHGLANPYAPNLSAAAKKTSIKEMAATAAVGGINALMSNYKKRSGINATVEQMSVETKRRLNQRFAPQASKDLTKFLDDMDHMTKKEKITKLKSLISGHTLFIFDDASGQDILKRNSRYWPFMTLIRHLKASGLMAYHEYKQSGTGLRTIMTANVTTKTGNPKEIEKIAEESGMLVSDFVPLLNSVTRLGKGNYLVNYMDGREKSRVINFKLGLTPEQIAEIVAAENAYVGALHGEDIDDTIQGHLANRVSNEGQLVGGTAILAKLLSGVPPDRMVNRSTIESVIPEVRTNLTPAQAKMLPKAVTTIKEVEAVVLPEIADPAKLAAEYLTLPVNRTSTSKPTVLGKRPHSPPRLAPSVLESTTPGIEKAGAMLAARYVPLQRRDASTASAAGRPRPGSYASGVMANGTLGADSAITQILARMAKKQTKAVRQATTSALIPRERAALSAGDTAGALAIRARIASVRRAPLRTLQAIAGSTPGFNLAGVIAEGQARRAGNALALRTGGKFNLPGARGGVTRASRSGVGYYGYGRQRYAGYGEGATSYQLLAANQKETISDLKAQLKAEQNTIKSLQQKPESKSSGTDYNPPPSAVSIRDADVQMQDLGGIGQLGEPGAFTQTGLNPDDVNMEILANDMAQGQGRQPKPITGGQARKGKAKIPKEAGQMAGVVQTVRQPQNQHPAPGPPPAQESKTMEALNSLTSRMTDLFGAVLASHHTPQNQPERQPTISMDDMRQLMREEISASAASMPHASQLNPEELQYIRDLPAALEARVQDMTNNFNAQHHLAQEAIIAQLKQKQEEEAAARAPPPPAPEPPLPQASAPSVEQALITANQATHEANNANMRASHEFMAGMFGQFQQMHADLFKHMFEHQNRQAELEAQRYAGSQNLLASSINGFNTLAERGMLLNSNAPASSPLQASMPNVKVINNFPGSAKSINVNGPPPGLATRVLERPKQHLLEPPPMEEPPPPPPMEHTGEPSMGSSTPKKRKIMEVTPSAIEPLPSTETMPSIEEAA